MRRPRIAFLLMILAYAVGIRLLPYILYNNGMSIDPESTLYPWNFSPIGALCLFGAVCYTQVRWAYIVPLAAMAISIAAIGPLTGNWEWVMAPSGVVAIGCYGLMVTLGLWARKRYSVGRLVGTAFAGELAFFLITNFAVWASQLEPTYTLDFAGLVKCYWFALPFFRNSLISQAIFLPLLFSPLMLKVTADVQDSHGELGAIEAETIGA